MKDKTHDINSGNNLIISSLSALIGATFYLDNAEYNYTKQPHDVIDELNLNDITSC